MKERLLNPTALIIFLLAFILIVLASITYVIRTDRIDDERNEAKKLLLDPVVAESFTDLLGNPVGLNNYEDSILVVYLWASWCPMCADDLVRLDQLAQAYADKNVVVLAINRNEPRERAERFLNQIGATNGLKLIIDTNDNFYRSVGAYAMPEVILFDTAGVKVLHQHSTLQEAEMKSALDQLVAQSND